MVAANDVERTGYAAADLTRAASVRFDASPAVPLGEPGRDLRRSVGIISDLTRIMGANQALGVMQSQMRATTDYLKSRKQFGVTLNTFQALTFRAADLYVSLELAHSIVDWATMTIATGDPDAVADAADRLGLQISRAGRHIGQEAIQLHGGIGMTAEYAVGVGTAHLTVLDQWLGNAPHHLVPAVRAGRRPRDGRGAGLTWTSRSPTTSWPSATSRGPSSTREAIPHRTAWDHAESVDLAIVPKMAELGFFGLTIPEQYGGVGGDYVTYALAMEELGRADSALRGIVSVSSGLVGKSILFHGTEEQKQEWLPALATATKLGCFGLTEPDTGSDAGNLTSRAVRDGSDWVINGQKLFITNGTWADVALVFARTSDDGPRGVTAFLVPTDTPGFEAREIKGKLGLRGQATAELFLSDVRVPDSAVLGEVGQGFKIAMGTLDKGRLAVAAGCVGIVQGCLEASVAYATTRTQFGQPIAAFQLVQDMIADISVDADAARLLVWRCADLDRPGRALRHRRLEGQAVRVRGRRTSGQPRDPGARRRRLRRRLPRREVPPRRPRDDALRRHLTDPEAADRAGGDGHQRVHLRRPPHVRRLWPSDGPGRGQIRRSCDERCAHPADDSQARETGYASFWKSPSRATGANPIASFTPIMWALTSALYVVRRTMSGRSRCSSRRLATFTATPSRWPRSWGRTRVPHW